MKKRITQKIGHKTYFFNRKVSMCNLLPLIHQNVQG